MVYAVGVDDVCMRLSVTTDSPVIQDSHRVMSTPERVALQVNHSAPARLFCRVLIVILELSHTAYGGLICPCIVVHWASVNSVRYCSHAPRPT